MLGTIFRVAAKFLWKNKFLTTGFAAAADQIWNDGDARKYTWNKGKDLYEEHFEDDVDEAIDEVKDDGIRLAREHIPGAEFLFADPDAPDNDSDSGFDWATLGLSGLAGFIGQWLGSKLFGTVGRILGGIAAVYFTYSALKEDTKNQYNTAAKGDGVDYTAAPKAGQDGVSKVFGEKGQELPTNAVKDVKTPASVGQNPEPGNSYVNAQGKLVQDEPEPE